MNLSKINYEVSRVNDNHSIIVGGLEQLPCVRQ